MKRLALLIALGFVTGCAFEASDSEDDALTEEELGQALSALMSTNELMPNGVESNGVTGNGVVGNGVVGNGLNVATLAPGVLAALQDTTTTGAVARKLTKYLASCAFNSGNTFDFTWNDGVQHNESYGGALGLADAWRTRALTTDEMAWVSACVVSRVNKLGVTVNISIRGPHGSLTTSGTEETDFNHKEGAFAGNIFAGTPTGTSCYVDGETTFAASKNRFCSSETCGVVTSVGSCSTACTSGATPTGYTNCFGTDKFIVIYLGNSSY